MNNINHIIIYRVYILKPEAACFKYKIKTGGHKKHPTASEAANRLQLSRLVHTHLS